MALALSHPFLRLRTITANDEDLLCRIYSSTRTEELAVVKDWSPGKKQAFLNWQFALQQTYYQNNYRGAHFWVIEFKGQVIGRLYLHPDYEKNSVRIIDIALLPQWRKQGLGQQILQDILAFAASQGRSVTIHVESFNPAIRLYKRLGFELEDITNGVYHLLAWKNKEVALS